MRLGPGPVFVYEWPTTARRWQPYAMRALFVAAILASLAPTWNQIDRNREFDLRPSPGADARAGRTTRIHPARRAESRSDPRHMSHRDKERPRRSASGVGSVSMFAMWIAVRPTRPVFRLNGLLPTGTLNAWTA